MTLFYGFVYWSAGDRLSTGSQLSQCPNSGCHLSLDVDQGFFLWSLKIGWPLVFLRLTTVPTNWGNDWLLIEIHTQYNYWPRLTIAHMISLPLPPLLSPPLLSPPPPHLCWPFHVLVVPIWSSNYLLIFFTHYCRNKQGLLPIDYAATEEMVSILSTSSPNKEIDSSTTVPSLPDMKGSSDSPKVLLATGLSSEQKVSFIYFAKYLIVLVVKQLITFDLSFPVISVNSAIT